MTQFSVANGTMPTTDGGVLPDPPLCPDCHDDEPMSLLTLSVNTTFPTESGDEYQSYTDFASDGELPHVGYLCTECGRNWIDPDLLAAALRTLALTHREEN